MANDSGHVNIADFLTGVAMLDVSAMYWLQQISMLNIFVPEYVSFNYTWDVYIAVMGRNRILFCSIFWPHYRVRNTVVYGTNYQMQLALALISQSAQHFFHTLLPCHLLNTGPIILSTVHTFFYYHLLTSNKFLNSAWKKFNTTMPPACTILLHSTWHYTRAELDKYKHDSCRNSLPYHHWNCSNNCNQWLEL